MWKLYQLLRHLQIDFLEVPSWTCRSNSVEHMYKPRNHGVVSLVGSSLPSLEGRLAIQISVKMIPNYISRTKYLKTRIRQQTPAVISFHGPWLSDVQ